MVPNISVPSFPPLHPLDRNILQYFFLRQTPNTKSGSIGSALHCLFWTLLIFQLRLCEDHCAEGCTAYYKQTHFPGSPSCSPALHQCNFILKFIHGCQSTRKSTCVQTDARAQSFRQQQEPPPSPSFAVLTWRASKAAPHLMSSCQFFHPPPPT